jgi:hypothetical protein
MTAHKLILSASQRALEKLGTEDFLWRRPPAESSFYSTVGPRLEDLGSMPELHADFVRLATLAYLVDRTVKRGRGIRRGTRWARDLSLGVPVADPAPWEAHAGRMCALLDFLTGDRWELQFTRRRLPRLATATTPTGDGPVLLFSGGADSLAGAILLREELGAPPVLLSQWNWSTIAGIQNQLVGRLEEHWDTDVVHQQIQLGRRDKQIGSGRSFGQEDSSRSRSLLFIALGLAAAAVRDTELVIAENGFTSLNVPLGGERRGALSTRTTHPGFLDALAETLQAVGLSVRLTTPFANLTKGALFGRIRDALDTDVASELLSSTHSCAKPGAQYLGAGFSPADQCGLCYGCLVRRAAFLASEVRDRTEYVEAKLMGDSRRSTWLDQGEKRSHATAVAAAVARGLRPADVLALSLPSRVDRREALALAEAGLAELSALDIDLS